MGTFLEPCCVATSRRSNYGDMTRYQEWPDAAIDVLVGGTPCQSFSVAGLRGGLDDARGNLMLTYACIARRYRPRWVVWENVPGVLSSNGDATLRSLLGLLSGRNRHRPRRTGGKTAESFRASRADTASHGECLTLSTSEWPSDAVACSLSDILETGDVPQRYF
jgi:site-specific DNA-cytosine methylase